MGPDWLRSLTAPSPARYINAGGPRPCRSRSRTATDAVGAADPAESFGRSVGCQAIARRPCVVIRSDSSRTIRPASPTTVAEPKSFWWNHEPPAPPRRTLGDRYRPDHDLSRAVAHCFVTEAFQPIRARRGGDYVVEQLRLRDGGALLDVRRPRAIPPGSIDATVTDGAARSSAACPVRSGRRGCAYRSNHRAATTAAAPAHRSILATREGRAAACATRSTAKSLEAQSEVAPDPSSGRVNLWSCREESPVSPRPPPAPWSPPPAVQPRHGRTGEWAPTWSAAPPVPVRLRRLRLAEPRSCDALVGGIRGARPQHRSRIAVAPRQHSG